jgi:superfamily II DNA or RNA helicase
MMQPTLIEPPAAPAFDLRPYQEECIANIIEARDRGLQRLLAVAPTGSGKAQPLDEPVLTPQGWLPIGSLAVGDWVIGSSGSPVRVVDVFPQGVKPVWRVYFTDGAWARCSPEHLWATATKYALFEARSERRGRRPHSPYKVRTLRELVDDGLLDSRGLPRLYVPLVAPVEFPRADLPLDPYLLGVLLGDGGLAIEGRVMVHTQDDVAAALPLPAGAHIHAMSDAGGGASNHLIGGAIGCSANPVMSPLRDLGLMGCHSYDKFIPKLYLRGVAADRLALLHGLLDTDGYAAGDSRAEYCTVSEQLAHDVQELVRSLGGVCRWRSKIPTYMHVGERREGRQAFTLAIALPGGLCPFRIPRKAGKWTPRTKYQPSRAIAGVEPEGLAEMVCIAVDSPDQLYVTRDYVLTHNTVIFSHLTHRLDCRTLVIAHREELIEQAANKLRAVLGDSATVGIVKAERNEVAADVLVGSIQTISMPRRITQLPTDLGLVIVDEVHHARAETYMRTLEHLGCWRPDGPLLVGVTATPDRADGKAIGDRIFQELVFERSMLDLIDERYLCDVKAISVRVKADLTKVHTAGGDFKPGELASALDDAGAPARVVEAYLEHGGTRKALAFTPSVAMAYDLADRFRAVGVSAEAIDGTTHPELRRATLRRLANGETRIVTNCAVLTEGFDEPSVECLLICRPTKSRGLFTQMLGRGLRTYPGKENCLVIDLAGNAGKHDVASVPNVFGLPEQQEVESAVKAVKQFKLDVEVRTKRAVEEARHVELVSREVNLFRVRSRLNWLVIPNSTALVLSLGEGLLKVGEAPGGWAVVLERRGRPRQVLARGLAGPDALRYGEDQARKLGEHWLLRADAGWRMRPVTERTRNFARNIGLTLGEEISAGEASDLITIQQAKRNARQSVAR